MIAIHNLANSRVMENDRDLIKALVEWSGKTASELAREAGLAVTTLTRPLNKPVTHSLSAPTLKKLKARYGDFPGFHTDTDNLPSDIDRSYLRVEVLPSFAGMGGGGTGEGEVETGLVPRNLIEDELHASTRDVILIEARGESMFPDFEHGDQILIDKRDRNPVQPGSFALWDGEGYVIKLVERVPQKPGFYKVFSANSRYSVYEVKADEVQIIGRPVWFARKL